MPERMEVMRQAMKLLRKSIRSHAQLKTLLSFYYLRLFSFFAILIANFVPLLTFIVYFSIKP